MNSTNRKALSKVEAGIMVVLLIIVAAGGYFGGTLTATPGAPVTTTTTVEKSTTVTATPGAPVTTTTTVEKSTTVTTTVTAKPPSGKPIRIAYVSSGEPTITWNAANLEGFRKAIKVFNTTDWPISVSYSFSVPVAEVKRVLEGYAAEGYDFIYAGDVPYEAIVLEELVPKYPNVNWMGPGWSGALSRTVSHHVTDWSDGYYLAGVIAGQLTESNVLGFVTAYEFPDTAYGYNAYRLGAESVNPNVKVLYTFTGDWHDASKGASAARAMIGQGADVMMGFGNGVSDGAIREAGNAGIWTFGNFVDQSALAPESVATSYLWNTTIAWVSVLASIKSGDFGYHRWSYGMRDGGVSLAPFNPKIPQSVVEKAEQVVSSIRSGEFTVPHIPTFPK